MSWYATELHKFVIGETYSDGRKTPWRIEQEKLRAEEMGKRQFVAVPAAPKIKPRPQTNTEHRKEIVRKSMTKLRARLLKEGICRDCQKNKVKEGRSSCQLCLTGRYKRQKSRRAELKKAA